jgi:hypothetical protein
MLPSILIVVIRVIGGVRRSDVTTSRSKIIAHSTALA